MKSTCLYPLSGEIIHYHKTIGDVDDDYELVGITFGGVHTITLSVMCMSNTNWQLSIVLYHINCS